MTTTKRWIQKNADEQKVLNLQQELNLKHQKICEILVQRGIETAQAAKDFFNPSLDRLHNPFLMRDMDKAVYRIREAMAKSEKIMIYGDYDVDGTTSVALMYLFLRDYFPQLEYYIPDRYSEGYGISLKGIDYAHQNNISLIIALDCGITANKQVDYALGYGIDFIICDHHLPSGQLPKAAAVLNAKRADCTYPFKELSGCGVGFKLCQALAIDLGLSPEVTYPLLDLVAVSIASDIVPIVGENRILAHFGLQKLNTNPSNGLLSLIEWAKIKDKTIDISDIVFYLGPRINASGRMAHAKASVEILIAEDVMIGRRMAEELDNINTHRRETDDQMTKEAISKIPENIEIGRQRTIVLKDADWHKGVIGIVASRIVERYYRPTIIFSENGDMLTGSARSIKGFSIYQGLKSCEELVVQFGGHDYAAGVSIPKANFQLFVEKFEAEASKLITDEMLIPQIEIDTDITLSEINDSFFKILKRMGPFGPQNMEPVFRVNNLKDAGGTRIVGNNHVRFQLKDEKENILQGICFGLGNFYDIADIKRNKLDVCFSLQENTFNGKTYIDFMIKDIIIKD